MRKKIILILNEAPLPFLGAACRWYYTLVTELISKSEDFNLVLFASCKKEEDLHEAKKLFPQGNFYLYPKNSGAMSKLKTLFRPYSYTIPDVLRKDLQLEIEKGYDVIHVEQTFAAWALEKKYPRMLLSVHYLANIDLSNATPKTLKENITLFLMKKTEKKLISNFEYLRPCSSRIENEIKKWFPRKSYFTFPFGIEKRNYQFLEDNKRSKSQYITLIATMTWYPGLSAAKRLIENIYPELKRLNPDLKLRIVGWGAKEALKSFNLIEGLEIFENVSDIRKYFYDAAILVYVPDIGTGVKIKIQEAMLFGTPIVTNKEGAEGLSLINGVHVCIGDTDSEIISLTNHLYNNYQLQNELRNNARSHIENTCDGKIIIEKMILTYDYIISNSQ